MTGARTRHLQRRNGTFHLRVRVPDDLKVRVGVREVRRSLHVASAKIARQLAPKYAARVLEAFAMIRELHLSRDESRELVQNCFSDLGREVERSFSVGLQPAEEIEQRVLADHAIRRLKAELTDETCVEHLSSTGQAVLAARGIHLENLSPSTRRDLALGVTRALIEQQHLFLFRLDDPLLPYRPRDALFVGASETDRSNIRLARSPVSEAAPLQVGPTTADLVQQFLAAKRSSWTPKTQASRARQLSYLVDHLGENRRVSLIGAADIRDFRDGVQRLRANHHVGTARTFQDRQTQNADHRIQAKTAAVIFEAAKGFFRWALQEGYLGFNPAADILLSKPKTAKSKRSRRPFTEAELKRFFAAPVFKGVKARGRRFDAGDLILKDAYFWIPLLAYFSGMRLGEIVQLHSDDVHLDGPLPYVMVTDEGGGALGSGNEKHLKSVAALRPVPLHPALMELGFADFVAQRRKYPKASKRLFWEIRFGADGQASTVFSKWFGRLLGKTGLEDPALVFHSFRHTAEDAFRNALLPKYVIDRVMGHAGTTTSDEYGEGVWLETAYAAVCSMKLKVLP